jgi:peptide methionine sulfoxide reductase msrA/msrB
MNLSDIWKFRNFSQFALAALIGANVGYLAAQGPKEGKEPEKTTKQGDKEKVAAPQTAVFAAGCFWSVETDFERCPGVIEVVAGYTGGKSKNPTYKTYASGAHREAVLITYDPREITYAGLVEFLIKHSNPVDRGGAFVDRGANYSPAIYYANDDEKKIAEGVIKKIDAMKVLRSAITMPVVKRSVFYPAETYHQDYHHKNPEGYASYRSTCGRDEFIFKTWGAKADLLSLPGSFPPIELNDEAEKERVKEEALLKSWGQFKKPAAAALKKKLTKAQFLVTQEMGTEKAFDSLLWNETRDGIYVDIVSGEPLFSSRDKLDLKDGWPTFSRSIVPSTVIAFKVGTKEQAYVEARSKFADSYLGRVILTDAGIGEKPVKRFIINGAALRFISLDKMAEEGYGEFVPFVKPAAKQEE